MQPESRGSAPVGSEGHPHNVPEVMHHAPQRWLKPAGFIALGVAAAVVGAGVMSRSFASADAKAITDAAAVPTVDVIRPVADASAEPLVLPGQVEANDVAVIHPRVNGYIKSWLVDIGAHVKAGQVLALIDTPDLDQQLAQARAALATAKANQNLAQISAARWQKLLKRDAASKQETDDKTGDLAAKTAQVEAAQADVSRLQALESFKRIVSPFDGVVTARNAHVGALVAAGAPNDEGLFTVADEHQLRIYVQVPQDQSARLRPGAPATLTVPEHPGQQFVAQLATTSEAVGAQTGALTAELHIDNRDNALQPGDYAQVSFRLAPTGGAAISVPASALMFRQKGMAVGVVDASDHAHLRYLTIRRDLGPTVEVAAGLSAGDRVINNPPDSLEEGQKVRVAAGGAAAQG